MNESRTIVTWDKYTILRLYKFLVRPKLEYFIHVWNPDMKQDMDNWRKCKEELQNDLRIWANYERMKKCGLERRGSRWDLIEVYKNTTGKLSLCLMVLISGIWYLLIPKWLLICFCSKGLTKAFNRWFKCSIALMCFRSFLLLDLS